MSGEGSFIRTNRVIPGAPPFAIGAAANGLSVDALGRIVLGQDVGAIGNPAILLNNREIPMGGFSFLMQDGGNRKFLIDNANSTYIFGDPDVSTHGVFFEIDNLGDVVINDNGTGQSYLTILPPGSGGTITLQDTAGWPGGMGFLLDGANGSITQGNISLAANASIVVIDDANQRFQFLSGLLGNPYIMADIPNDVWILGDLNGATSNTLLYLDGTNTFAVQSGGNQLIDIGGSVGIWNFGAIAWGNGTKLRVNDNVAVQQVQVLALNGLQVPGAGFLIHTAAPLTNNAAGNLGTLTNSPAAGDPTKWIAIDDAGTTRFIPAW